MAQSYKGNLELNWINKDKSLYYEYDEDGNPEKPIWIDKNDIRVSEPRILKLVGEYGDVSNLNNPLDNALIRGDNLLTLKSLVEMFKERDEQHKVKLIFIDPPFNTKKAFENYDDNLENSQWLTLMRDRLILLKTLMRKDGIIFIHIDDRFGAYLKILMDEIFGRQNFVNTICLATSTPSGPKTAHKDKTILKQKEYIHVYKNGPQIKLKPLYKRRKKWDTHFNLFLNYDTLEVTSLKEILIEESILDSNGSNEDLDMDDKKFRGFYLKHKDNICQTQSIRNQTIKKKSQDLGNNILVIENDDGSKTYYRNGRQLVPLKDVLKEILTYEGRNLRWEEDLAILLCDFWDDVNFTNTQTEGTVSFPASKKPEFLLQRIIHMTTEESDLVLDCFAGSGTTAAVAHKNGRRWITIEIGKHAETHCIKRLNALMNGQDQDKIEYGGGFRYYQLGDSLINEDSINWGLTYEEISKAFFMNFDYSYDKKLDESTYVGKSGHNFALCIVSKEMKIIKKNDLEQILSSIQQLDNVQIVIYTNHGVAIKNQDLPDNIMIKKIPESILSKYKL